MAVCCIILRGQHIFSVIQAVYSLFYIVAKCHFFSVVTRKDILKYLWNVRGVSQWTFSTAEGREMDLIIMKKKILTKHLEIIGGGRSCSAVQCTNVRQSQGYFFHIACPICSIAVVPNLGSPDILGLKLPEAFTTSCAGQNIWEL